ncbi:MAG: DUF4868 domain-containing protein, partial [Armatimonadota bacterium]|nr:DUF4868 domain-containing protein [Armatimonadota bacterium]
RQIASLWPLDSLDICDLSAGFVSGLRFYVIVVEGDGGEPLYCFRSYNKQKELSRSRHFAVLLSAGHFNRVREPLLLFDQDIDCISQGRHMYVFKKSNFQKIFRFFEMMLATAEETLKVIKAKIPITNFDEFHQACQGHLQMMAKLKNIAGKDYLNRITMADLQKVITKCKLKVQVENRGGKDMLVFDAANKWELLRLLDDDYLESLMTGQSYEVTGKRVHS